MSRTAGHDRTPGEGVEIQVPVDAEEEEVTLPQQQAIEPRPETVGVTAAAPSRPPSEAPKGRSSTRPGSGPPTAAPLSALMAHAAADPDLALLEEIEQVTQQELQAERAMGAPAAAAPAPAAVAPPAPRLPSVAPPAPQIATAPVPAVISPPRPGSHPPSGPPAGRSTAAKSAANASAASATRRRVSEPARPRSVRPSPASAARSASSPPPAGAPGTDGAIAAPAPSASARRVSGSDAQRPRSGDGAATEVPAGGTAAVPTDGVPAARAPFPSGPRASLASAPRAPLESTPRALTSSTPDGTAATPTPAEAQASSPVPPQLAPLVPIAPLPIIGVGPGPGPAGTPEADSYRPVVVGAGSMVPLSTSQVSAPPPVVAPQVSVPPLAVPPQVSAAPPVAAGPNPLPDRESGEGVEVDIDDEALESVPPTPPPPGYSLAAQSEPSELRVPAAQPTPDINVSVGAGVELEGLGTPDIVRPQPDPTEGLDDDDEPERLSGRISDIPPEVAPEDFEVTDPTPRATRQVPPAPAASATKGAADGAAIDPLAFSGAASAPPALSEAAAAAGSADAFGPEPSTVTARKRYWWEELFGDDFLRTMKPMTDSQMKAEAAFIEQRLALEKGALILDLACGTGRHAVELSSRGYNVVGYDLSLAMLARAADEAQERGQKINFLHGDMRELDFEEAFDAVICWTTSFGYFDDEKNFAVAQRIQRALRPGGLLLIDVVNRDFVAQMQPALAWFEGEGCVCMDEARLDFFSSRLKVKRTVMLDDGRSREIDYSMRVYSLHELGRLLHDAGFKVTEVTGRTATPGVFLGAESPRLIVLAEKP